MHWGRCAAIGLLLPQLILPSEAQELLMSPGAVWNTCTGTFHDSGGPSGAYGNSENMVAVLCPLAGAYSGGATVVHFTSFQVGSLLDGSDQLVVYNGHDNAGQVLATGNYAIDPAVNS